MSNKDLFVKAHKMTKEIKREYPEVNYMFQFSLCLSYLKEEGENTMVELKGTEKQVKWAEDIREDYLKTLEKIMNEVKKVNMNYMKPIMQECKEEILSKIAEKTHEEAARVMIEILTEIKDKIENEESSKKFIEVYNSHRYFEPHEVNAINVLGEFR